MISRVYFFLFFILSLVALLLSLSAFIFRFEEFFALTGPKFLQFGPLSLLFEGVEQTIRHIAISLGITLSVSVIITLFTSKKINLFFLMGAGFACVFVPTGLMYQKHIETNRISHEIIQHINQKPVSTNILDNARHFIARNASFQDSTVFYDRYAFDTGVVLKTLFQHELGNEKTADLLCGPSALAMQRLLKSQNIDSRVIFLWSTEGLVDGSHVILEAQNPNTGRWEAHDPMYNLFFTGPDGNRLSIAQLTQMENMASVKACNNSSCGWAETKAIPYLDHGYFAAIEYPQSHSFLLNSKRFDLSKKFPSLKDRTLEEYFRRARANPVFIELGS
ncbi:hypothetical protein [Terasakiella sp. SH-1]|uniref:hypothetical protein n=1 Tax=Terasakiella sp. SH-1 TaxID=2560057 RepID=UPI001074504E|nr:hypothetical protein [Terasakiella sp. SH-1]